MGYYPAPNAKTEKNPTPELYITHSLTHSLQKMETLGLSVKNSKHKYTFQFAHCNFHAIFNHFPTHWIRPSMGWHFWISFRYRFLANIIYIYICIIYISRAVWSRYYYAGLLFGPSALVTSFLRFRSAVELQTRPELRPQLTKFSFSCSLARILDSEKRKSRMTKRGEHRKVSGAPLAFRCRLLFSRSEPKLTAGSLRSSLNWAAFRVPQSFTADCRQCMRHFDPSAPLLPLWLPVILRP